MILNNINCSHDILDNIINAFIVGIFKIDGEDSENSEDSEESTKMSIPDELWDYFENKHKSKNSLQMNNLNQEEVKIMFKCYQTIKFYLISLLNELNNIDFWKTFIDRIIYINKHKNDDNSKLSELKYEYDTIITTVIIEIKHRFDINTLMNYVNEI